MRTLHSLTLVALVAAATLGCQSNAMAPSGTTGGGSTDELTLTVAPSVATIDGGKVMKLTATLRHPDGSISAAADASWQSADGQIATVAADGTVQGLRAGRVQIVATWHDSRGSSVVTVREPVIKKGPPRCIEPRTRVEGAGI
ncbi:MAG: Ig-like domain-containing protein, partial [Gemmatimonadales bacterium]